MCTNKTHSHSFPYETRFWLPHLFYLHLSSVVQKSSGICICVFFSYSFQMVLCTFVPKRKPRGPLWAVFITQRKKQQGLGCSVSEDDVLSSLTSFSLEDSCVKSWARKMNWRVKFSLMMGRLGNSLSSTFCVCLGFVWGSAQQYSGFTSGSFFRGHSWWYLEDQMGCRNGKESDICWQGKCLVHCALFSPISRIFKTVCIDSGLNRPYWFMESAI